MGSIPRLFDFKANTLAEAEQVNEEFDNVMAAIEGVSTAAVGADVYQKGVIVATDWNPVVVTYAAGGGLSIKTALGGAAWLPGPAGSLVRTFTPPQEWLGLVAPALPAASAYIGLGFELAVSGAEATLHVVAGPERGTSAEALAAIPAPAAERVRISDQTIFNKVGTYEWGKGLRDRRPWALGAVAYGTALPQRLELSTGNTAITLSGTLGFASNEWAGATVFLDGDAGGIALNMFHETQALHDQAEVAVAGSRTIVLAKGSHLFEKFEVVASGAAFKEWTNGPFWTIRELPVSATNGTA